MQAKEILEEIEMKKKKCLDIVRVEIDPMEITIHREQYKGLRMAEDIIRKHMNDGWIPVEERLPEDDRYIFLSFENFLLPMIGRYEQDSDGSGNFYIGDETESCIDQDMYVTAWRPLLEPYRPERSGEE